MLHVKIVIQGGGAKLVTLMAAASVIKELENEKEIKITKIVGTSAGAIVACMLASNLPIEAYRERVQKAGNELIKNFSIKKWKKLALMIKLLAGGRVLKEEMLRLFFRKVFNGQTPGDNESELDLASLRMPTIIIASNLTRSEKMAYSSTDELHMKRKVVDVLCDSCALPLVFRSFKDEPFIVDGGVCSNLAAEELLRDSDEADVLGFTFPNDGVQEPTNIWKYAASLLWAAMSSGVQNNAERIKLAGGEVCELPNDYGTLQFEEALNNGLKGETFKAIKERIKPKLEDALKRFYRQRAIRVSAAKLPGRVIEAHKNVRVVYPYEVIRSSTVIVAKGLLPKAHPNFNYYDDVCQVIEYRPTGDHIIALRVGVSKGKAIPLASETACTVKEVNGNDIPATWFLVPEAGPEGPYLALIYFSKLVPAASGPIKVILYTQQENLLLSLKRTGLDYLRSKAAKSSKTTREDFVVISDMSLVLSDLKKDVSLLPAEQTPTMLDQMRANWTQGRLMRGDEFTEYLNLVQVPDTCHIYGWRTQDIEANHYCGVLLNAT